MHDDRLGRAFWDTTPNTSFAYTYFDEPEFSGTTSTTTTADHEDAIRRAFDAWRQYTKLKDAQSFTEFGLGNKPTIEEAGLIPEEYEASWEELMGGQNGSK